MANRLVLLVSVVLAGVAPGASSARAAPAADECLAKPKGVAPAGKHWYYRTNRDIQRKCWYLGDEGTPITAVTPAKQATTPPKRQVAAPPADPDQKIDVRPPTANARAELIDEGRVEPPAPATPPQPEATQAAPEETTARNWAIASRWPDPSAFASDPAAPLSEPAPATRVENPPPVLAAPPAPQPSVAVEDTGGISFGQFAAGLILVVIAGGTIFMSFDARRLRRRVARDDMHDYEMPWTGAAAATGSATGIGAPEQRRLSDEIEELDRLLATARETRTNQAGLGGTRNLRWRPEAS